MADDNQEKYEQVQHPNHYNRYSIEAVEMARRRWGDDAMKTAAEITAFFYRMRMGLKPDNSVEQELAKENFWLNYAKELEESQRLRQERFMPMGREVAHAEPKKELLTD